MTNTRGLPTGDPGPPNGRDPAESEGRTVVAGRILNLPIIGRRLRPSHDRYRERLVALRLDWFVRSQALPVDEQQCILPVVREAVETVQARSAWREWAWAAAVHVSRWLRRLTLAAVAVLAMALPDTPMPRRLLDIPVATVVYFLIRIPVRWALGVYGPGNRLMPIGRSIVRLLAPTTVVGLLVFTDRRWHSALKAALTTGVVVGIAYLVLFSVLCVGLQLFQSAILRLNRLYHPEYEIIDTLAWNLWFVESHRSRWTTLSFRLRVTAELEYLAQLFERFLSRPGGDRDAATERRLTGHARRRGSSARRWKEPILLGDDEACCRLAGWLAVNLTVAAQSRWFQLGLVGLDEDAVRHLDELKGESPSGPQRLSQLALGVTIALVPLATVLLLFVTWHSDTGRLIAQTLAPFSVVWLVGRLVALQEPIGGTLAPNSDMVDLLTSLKG